LKTNADQIGSALHATLKRVAAAIENAKPDLEG
jgi:hypothetical protein